jgi:hypothetical protein
MKRTLIGLALAAAAFLAGTGAQAQQFTLVKNVLGSGGQAMASSEFAIVGTVGQPTIGLVSNATNTGHIGFWFVARPTVGVEEPVVARTGGNVLEQNFPNPFKEQTTIKFNLVKRSDVTLKVFNAAGQEISTLAAGEYEAGSHEVTLQGHEISSGVYVYQLQVGSFVLQRQMLVVR